jgi:uncharacterized membrane protein (DUF485 family)
MIEKLNSFLFLLMVALFLVPAFVHKSYSTKMKTASVGGFVGLTAFAIAFIAESVWGRVAAGTISALILISLWLELRE